MKRERLARFQGVIGLCALATVLISALALGANRPVSWSFLSIFIILIFALQVGVIFANPVPLALRRATVPGLLFVAAVFWGWVQSTPGLLSVFAHPVWALVPDAMPAISADPGQGRHAVMRLLCYACVFVIVLCTCTRSARAVRVLKAIAVFSNALAAYGLYAFLSGTNAILGEMAHHGMVQASFVNRNSYATYAAFGVLANIAVFLHVSARIHPGLRPRLEAFFAGAWIYALGVLLCLGALTLTGSRAGNAAALVGLAVFLVAWRAGNERRDLVMLGLIGAVLIFVGATSATGLLERMVSLDGADGRFIVYPAVIDGILDRPLLGHGLGAFHEAFRPFIPLEAAFGEWVRAHNTYLELTFGLGLPAALAFFLAQGILVARIWRGTIERRRNRVFSCFALGCVATAAVHSAFDFSLQMPATAALFAVILALGFAQSFGHRHLDHLAQTPRTSRFQSKSSDQVNEPDQALESHATVVDKTTATMSPERA